MSAHPSPSIQPSFVGDAWPVAPRGYSFESPPPPDLADERNLADANEWTRVLCIFQRAKVGQFDGLRLLPAIIRESQDFYIRAAGLRLLGDAAAHPVSAIPEFYRHPDLDTRFAAYQSSAASGEPAFVGPLLAALAGLQPGIERDILADGISLMLEEEPAILCEPRSESYEQLVWERFAQVQQLAGAGKPVRFGKLLAIETLIERIMLLASQPDVQVYSGGLVPDYLLLFESMTGIPCAGLFDEEGGLYPASIMTMLKTFRESGEISHYPPGQRYFFGHPVPQGGS